MARLFNIPNYSTVETVNMAAVRTGEMVAQYAMADALTQVENGQVLAFNHIAKTVSLPASSEDLVVLAASEERTYGNAAGLAYFKTEGADLPRLLYLKAGDKFETNAVDAGDFTTIEQAMDPVFGAKYGLPSTTGDIKLHRALPGDKAYKTIFEVVEFITLPGGAPGVRFAVQKAGAIGLEVDESSEAAILNFTLPEQTKKATINPATKTVAIEVKYGTTLTALTAGFVLSPFATAKVGAINQVSGTTKNNFTSNVTYVITAEDGTTSVNWTITVTVAEPVTDADFLTFTSEEFTKPAIINTVAKTITAEAFWDADITALIPKFTVSPYATVGVGSTAQTSGVTSNDFTSAVTYTVTPQSGSAVNWTVTITLED